MKVSRPVSLVLTVSVAAVAAVVLGSCSSGSVPIGAAHTTSPSASATTPATSPATSPTTPATTDVPKIHDAAALKPALMELDDLPAGWQIETDNTAAAGAVSVTSRDRGCAAYLAFANATTAPGSRADAMVSFSGGQDGPYVDEGIDTLADVGAVAALQAGLASAVSTCHEVTLTIGGQGSSTMTLAKVSAPRVGDHPFAARLTAHGGALDGLELTQFSAGVDDTVLSLSFVGAYADEIDGTTQSAVAKAQQVLGATGAAGGAIA